LTQKDLSGHDKSVTRLVNFMNQLNQQYPNFVKEFDSYILEKILHKLMLYVFWGKGFELDLKNIAVNFYLKLARYEIEPASE
jgi:hypothetical protein